MVLSKVCVYSCFISDKLKWQSASCKSQRKSPLKSICDLVPGVMLSSLEMARLQTLPLTLGGRPCHQSSLALRVFFLHRGRGGHKGRSGLSVNVTKNAKNIQVHVCSLCLFLIVKRNHKSTTPMKSNAKEATCNQPCVEHLMLSSSTT